MCLPGKTPSAPSDSVSRFHHQFRKELVEGRRRFGRKLVTRDPSRFLHRMPGERTIFFFRDPSPVSGPECALILPQSGTVAPTQSQPPHSNGRGRSSLQTSASCRSRTGPPRMVIHKRVGAKLFKPAVRFLLRYSLFQNPHRVLPLGSQESACNRGRKYFNLWTPPNTSVKPEWLLPVPHRSGTRTSNVSQSTSFQITACTSLPWMLDYPRPPLPSVQIFYMIIKNGDPATTLMTDENAPEPTDILRGHVLNKQTLNPPDALSSPKMLAVNQVFTVSSLFVFTSASIRLTWRLPEALSKNTGACLFIFWAGFSSFVWPVNPAGFDGNIFDWTPLRDICEFPIFQVLGGVLIRAT